MTKVTKQWTCRDGSKVRICDMTDSHIKNTIAMLERSYRHGLNTMYSIYGGLQGEEAIACLDRDIWEAEEIGPAYVNEIYDDLTLDLQRRAEVRK